VFGVFLFFGGAHACAAQTDSTFLCLDKTKDAAVWARVEAAMAKELKPPHREGLPDSEYYARRSVYKVCVVESAALIILEYQPLVPDPSTEKWDKDFEAFNLDMRTGKYAPVEGKDPTWLWNLVKFARFEPGGVPDLVFTSFGCVECDGGRVVSSYRFDATTKTWAARQFSDGKDNWWDTPDSIVVDAELVDSDAVLFDCAFGVDRYTGGDLDELFVRCKEITQADSGDLKIADQSFLYGWKDGKFQRVRVTNSAQVKSFTAKACETLKDERLCTLPNSLEATYEGIAEAEKMRKRFPNAQRRPEGLDSFRQIKKGMSLKDVIILLGVPDAIEGAGTVFYQYYLGDGSFVVVIGMESVDDVRVVRPDGSIEHLL